MNRITSDPRRGSGIVNASCPETKGGGWVKHGGTVPDWGGGVFFGPLLQFLIPCGDFPMRHILCLFRPAGIFQCVIFSAYSGLRGLFNASYSLPTPAYGDFPMRHILCLPRPTGIFQCVIFSAYPGLRGFSLLPSRHFVCGIDPPPAPEAQTAYCLLPEYQLISDQE
jgi:hypothetical protein